MAPNEQASLDTPGGRLTWAIGEQPRQGRRRGLRMFERAMRERSERVHGGITGATLPSIKAYMADTAWPSKVFWDHAGAVLGVRPVWLAFGQGAPTDEQEHEAREVMAEREGTADKHSAAAMRGIFRTLPDLGIQAHLTFEYRHLAAVALKVALALQERGAAPSLATYERAGALVGQCLTAPLDILRAAFPLDEGRMVQAYASAAATAVEILAPYADRSTAATAADDVPPTKRATRRHSPAKPKHKPTSKRRR